MSVPPITHDKNLFTAPPEANLTAQFLGTRYRFHSLLWLQETVGVNVDADPNPGVPVDGGEPVADHVLDIEAAPGVHQQALAVAAAEHGERGGGGAEYRHAFDLRRGMADAASDGLGFVRVLGRDDDRREPPERGHGGLAACLGLGGVEACCVSFDERRDDLRIGIVGLDEYASGLVAAAGAAGDLLDLLEAALGRAQVAAGEAEIGVDDADQSEIGE